MHGLFQLYYFGQYRGIDRNGREAYLDHEWYQSCVDFCERWDQASFDPDFETKPLEYFEPMIREVFSRAPFDPAPAAYDSTPHRRNTARQHTGDAGTGRGRVTGRAVRVFVSSTFRDMQDEREELVKRVFPSIRRMCEQRGVAFSEVDLRWGVTDEQKAEGAVLPICLAEIDRSRPYFIGLHRAALRLGAGVAAGRPRRAAAVAAVVWPTRP